MSCSRMQSSVSNEAQTGNHSTLSQSFYHCVTALFVYNIAMYSLCYICGVGVILYCFVVNFTDCSKAVLLLWIICYSCLVFVMLSCLFIAALWSHDGKGLTSWLSFMMSNCEFVTFQCGILGQVWYSGLQIFFKIGGQK